MCLASCCQSHSCSHSQGWWLFPHSTFLDGTNAAFAAQLILQTYISQGERRESWAEGLPKRQTLSEVEWSLHLRSKLVLLVWETQYRGGSFQNWWLLSCSKILCPSSKNRFPWRTVCSPQKLQAVSRENFATEWSLTFNFRLCFFFSLGLMRAFSGTAMLIHFSKQVVKNVEEKIPLLPSGFTLPSSEDRSILHTFATTVTSAPPPPEIKTLSQEKQSCTGEDCTFARKLCT